MHTWIKAAQSFRGEQIVLHDQEVEMTKRKGIINRIEKKWIVEFHDGMRCILISRFPMTVESNDVIWMDEYGHIEKDDQERQQLSEEIDGLMEELWED